MGGNEETGLSGKFLECATDIIDHRKIIIAEGIQYHGKDGNRPVFKYLKKNLPGFVGDENSMKAEYTNCNQRVKYTLEVVRKKSELKEALQKEEKGGIIVVYAGHSRFGRGACFDDREGPFKSKKKVKTKKGWKEIEVETTYMPTGNQWENGTKDHDDGLFRLGYPYVPVPLHDIWAHRYEFAPFPVTSIPADYYERKKKLREKKLLEEEDLPYTPLTMEDGHNTPQENKADRELLNFEKDFRKMPLEIFTLPKKLKRYVSPEYRAKSSKYIDKYWGFWKREGKKDVRYLILNAGWKNTQCTGFDLGSIIKLKCRAFCHFGCSSRDHFWHIIKDPNYFGWDGPAYFTTAPGIVWDYWVYCLLICPSPLVSVSRAVIDKHWKDTLLYAMNNANVALRKDEVKVTDERPKPKL